jgi:hypothetical protein
MIARVDGPPTCLLHVPKAAGTSMRIAIQRALPHGALAPWHSEPAVYADFSRFDEMKDPFRSTIALNEEHFAALGAHAAVFGHFTLSTLLRLSEPSSIGTVLREPRSRLLSHYAYWRTEPGLAERVAPYHMPEHAQRRLDEFLAEPRIARQTDNIVCRLLLFGDERLPDTDFIALGDVAALADAAIARLDSLAFVGIMERHDEAWRGVGELFGVQLEPLRLNVTVTDAVTPANLPAPAWHGERVIELLGRRCAVDELVYRTILARRCGGEEAARRAAGGAFARQLVRFGDTTGESAAALFAPDERFDGLRRDVEERDREIARLHAAVAERDEEIAALRTGANGRSRRLRLRWPFGS